MHRDLVFHQVAGRVLLAVQRVRVTASREISAAPDTTVRTVVTGRVLAWTTSEYLVLPGDIFLQERGDISQVVEHRENTSDWYHGVIDRQIKDVELTGFHLQVAPRVSQKQAIVKRIGGRNRARLRENLTP